MTFSIPPQFLAAQTCTHRTDLSTMSAELWIASYDDCPLEIDPSTLEASGTCRGLQVGIERYIALSYFFDSPRDELALIVSWVDLTSDNIPESGNLQVSLDPSAEEVVMVTSDLEVDAFPASTGEAGSAATLERAKAWARARLEEGDLTFDGDADTCSNLGEVCNGTYSDGGHLSPCP